MEGQSGAEGTCVVCKTSCSQQCVRCLNVYYCSKDHQKKDWKNHKETCHPVKIVEGRLIATCDIAPGQIMIKEKPILTGPRVDDDFVHGGFRKFPICLDCYKIVGGGYRCSKCRWPVCSQICENGKMHSNFECPIFVENAVSPIEREELIHYGSICVLRGLLLGKVDPEKWDQLRRLPSNEKEIAESEGPFETNYQYMVEFLVGECGLKQFDLKTIGFVTAVLQSNRLCNEDSDFAVETRGDPYGSYFYYKSSFANHSCIPNSMWYIQTNQDLYLRASVPIKRGELITTSCVQMEEGTFIRRAQLKKYYIDCKCPRCQDATELRTYMSAVKCRKCDDGYYLMESPLEQNSQWKCNKEGCAHVEKGENIQSIVGKAQSDYSAIDEKWSSMPNINELEWHLKRLEVEERFLKKHEGKILHKNHSILFRCKKNMSYIIPQIAIFVDNDVQRMELEKKQVGWVRDCLDLANIFWPGYSRYRGQLLYVLQRGLFCQIFTGVEILGKARRSAKYNMPRVLLLQQSFKEVLKIRKEVQAILGIESDGKVEKEHALEMETEGEDFANVRRLLGLPPSGSNY